MSYLRSGVAVVFALAAGWGTARLAQACTAPACVDGALAPSDGNSIPANQTVLVVQASPATAEPKPGVDLNLESGGMPVPFSIKKSATGLYWMITPERLTAGASYKLTYAYQCGLRGQVSKTSNFSVTASPAAAPTTAGSLKALGAGTEGQDKVNPPGDCSIDYRYAFSRFALVVSPDLAPYLAVTRVLVALDGKPHSELGYGTVSPKGLPSISVTARCKPTGAAGEVALGKHTLKVSLEVANGPTLTLPDQEIELVCQEDPAGKDGGVSPPSGADAGLTDGGSPPAADAGTGDPSVDGGGSTAADAGTSLATNDSGCDCSLGRGRARSSAPGAGLLALVALVVVGRRGRRR